MGLQVIVENARGWTVPLGAVRRGLQVAPGTNSAIRQPGPIRSIFIQRPTQNYDIKMAVDVKERHNSYTRGNCFTTIGIKKLYPTLSPKIEGIKGANSNEK
ncbi:hypothetical protein GT037_004481 [Alternaria burnsii]|uniref:Uncharacterized protein n=1 Tax=Alternaria burnsii TaxID=1187904 RepID=A0A8H7B766_9PLEO|nr:uncharacterized protein GT037_004481 [Alternaria burnsii]KAF7677622.1 hypothetical protein GT037_004481 [Alternaria burnsii]